MVREICKDPAVLQKISAPATYLDLPAAMDLRDTLSAHSEECIGMAANMIGVLKRIIVVSIGRSSLLMFNPEVLQTRDPFEMDEGCLSIDGIRRVTRYREIEVSYQDIMMKKRRETFHHITAQAILHEIDHLNGILI